MRRSFCISPSSIFDDGDAGPARDDLRDVLGVDLLLEHLLLFLQLRQLRVARRQLLLELRQRAVAQLRGLVQVALALGLLDLPLRPLELLLERADPGDRLLLVLPARPQGVDPLLEPGHLAGDLLEALARGGVLLLRQRGALDLQLHRAALQLVDLGRHRVDLDAQLRRRLVDQVDRLVGQEAVRDVARGERRGRDERRVRDPHAVVHLVALLEAAQDRDRVLDARLADVHRLEAPLERRVLLDVLAVLVQRRRADRAQLAARQRRLEHVRGVDRPLGPAGADDRVQLVDEEDDLAVALGDLLEHGLEPVLELAAVLGAGDQRADVEGDQPLVLQRLGDVAVDDAPRQPLDDRGLADARLADEHGVVLRAPREHLHHAADLLVPADHRVELAAARLLGQVAPEAQQRLVLLLRVLVGDALGAAHRLHRLEDRLARHACGLENRARASPPASVAASRMCSPAM